MEQLPDEYYKKLEESIEELIAMFQTSLDKEVIENARLSIWHGEYGVAFDDIVHSLIEEEIPITPDIMSRIKVLAETMEMLDETPIDVLELLVIAE